jgi:hypothetical protein
MRFWKQDTTHSKTKLADFHPSYPWIEVNKGRFSTSSADGLSSGFWKEKFEK